MVQQQHSMRCNGYRGKAASMAKNIVVLNGSPRKKGNTSELVRAFAEGAEGAGHQVTEFFLNGMNVHGCLGCFGGGKDPAHPCVQSDDMDSVYAAYREADVVVLASPLYYWGISGQLKIAFDRLFAVAECDPDYRNPVKESVLLMAAEGDGFEESAQWYDNLERHIGWKSLGKVLCGSVMQVGDIAGKLELEEARALGAQVQ